LISGLHAGALSSRDVDLLIANKGSILDKHAAVLPWRGLARDLSTASSGGGRLVPTEVGDAEAVLRPYSVLLQAGTRMIDNLASNLTIPRSTSGPTAYWLADELSPITESTPVLGQTTLSPKFVATFMETTRLLRIQSPAVEAYISRELLGSIAEAIDTAVLGGGTGASGEPLPITAASGVGSVSGSTFNWTGVQAALELARDGGGRNLAWVVAPDAAEILSLRPRFTSNERPVLDGNDMGAPAYVSRAVPNGTAVLADWDAAVLLASWGSGPKLELDPFSGFTTQKIGCRAIAQIDCGVLHAGAIVVVSSIT
jgi:HK97 family phage major capsid protein